MNRALAFVLLTCSTVPLAIGQCVIRPIKPIPPIGCKDVTPECVSDSNGRSHWNWICVPNNGGTDTSNNPAWKPHAPKPTTPSGANVNTVQTIPHASVNAAFQEPATAIGIPIGEMDAGEQHAAEQLLAIAEGIKNCPPERYKLPSELTLASDGFIETEGPPINVVWNVELSSSVRARYLGSIEYVFPFSEMPPLESSLCNKRGVDKRKCGIAWEAFMEHYKRQDAHPRQFRYEFDVTPHGLDFLRAFTKVKQTDDEPWVAGGVNSEVCANTAIRSTLNNPNNAAPTSTPPITLGSQGGTQDNGQAQGNGSADIHQGPSDISAVGIGMTRDVVLSGLASRYKLAKEDLDVGPESKWEVWSVEEKASSTTADYWEIFFKDGKVGSVITHLSPTLHGDAVALAQQLFAELYPRADADPGQVAKFLGTRSITLEVELGQTATAKSNEETMRFHFQKGSAFEIKIEAPLASAPTVSTSNFKTE